MECLTYDSHDFKRSHPRRIAIDHSGRTWFLTLLKCRHCGYRDFRVPGL
jgi:hypothetical protein